MNNLIHFNFKGNTLNALIIDGEPYFIARNVAEILGYAKPENAIGRHCKASVTTPKQGGGYITVIPERDVYRLVMRSKLPEAEQFEEWVVSEVLPSIRKNGSYIFNGFNIPQSYSEALRLSADLAEANQKQQLVIEQQKPAVEFVEKYVNADGNMTFRQVAKILDIKEPIFKLFLIEQGIIYYANRTMTPYQKHIDAGRFIVKTGVNETSEHAYSQMKFTPKGVEWIARLWNDTELGVVA